MANKLRFSETILSTPDPIHCSSLMAESKKKISLTKMDDLPERDCDTDNSLGLLSINSDDCRLSDTGKLREMEREKARNTLRNYDQKRDFKGLESRYLRPSVGSKDSSYFDQYIHSESTVSESDLLPTNTSTPRESLFHTEKVMREERHSMGKRLASIGSLFRNNNNYTLEQLKGDLNNTINPKSLSMGAVTPLKGSAVFPTADSKACGSLDLGDITFESGEAAMEKLDKDELSWKKHNYIPAPLKEFSNCARDSTASMGSFFIQRSDDIPELFAKSPQKQSKPIPLISDITPTNIGSVSLSVKDSLDSNHMANNTKSRSSVNVEDIAQIISEMSTGNAIEELFNMKKNRKSKSPIRKSKSPNRKSKSPKRKSMTNNLDEVKVKNFGPSLKENLSPDLEKSMVSVRSTSSLSSLPNGKLPIASTKTELIWGCIKPGKTSSQELVIRNRSASRLGMQCTLTNPSFRINKDSPDLNFLSTVKLVLHPYESRVVTLTFSPTTVGAAVDYLTFTSSDPTHKQTVNQNIRLFGYGGSGIVTFHNIIKDTTGKFLLALGNIDEDLHLKRSFVVKNQGSLPSFAYISFIINTLFLSSNVDISPKAVVLLPGQQKEVIVTYHLQKKDFNFIKSKINNCVIDIGKLQVVHGTEIDRARLRRVIQKAKEKNQPFNPFISELIADFPGEVAIPDLKSFKESISSLEEIMKLLNKEEITITLEQDVDMTMINNLQDETEMFHSLCETTVVDTDATIYKDTVVEPTRIILTPPDKMKDRIFFTNNNKKTVHFEVNVAPEGLLLMPRSGAVNSGETSIIEVHYTKQCNDKTVFKVKIFVDNDYFEVDVKVMFCMR